MRFPMWTIRLIAFRSIFDAALPALTVATNGPRTKKTRLTSLSATNTQSLVCAKSVNSSVTHKIGGILSRCRFNRHCVLKGVRRYCGDPSYQVFIVAANSTRARPVVCRIKGLFSNELQRSKLHSCVLMTISAMLILEWSLQTYQYRYKQTPVLFKAKNSQRSSFTIASNTVRFLCGQRVLLHYIKNLWRCREFTDTLENNKAFMATEGKALM